MTKQQQDYVTNAWSRSRLQPENFVGIEYPAGITRNKRTYLDTVKLQYKVGERLYIDWIAPDGWAVATETRLT